MEQNGKRVKWTSGKLVNKGVGNGELISENTSSLPNFVRNKI